MCCAPRDVRGFSSVNCDSVPSKLPPVHATLQPPVGHPSPTTPLISISSVASCCKYKKTQNVSSIPPFVPPGLETRAPSTMTTKSRIAELASIIQEKTAIVDEYFTSRGIPPPSFNESSPPVLQLPNDVAAARDAAAEASDELAMMLRGPVTSFYNEFAKSSFYSSIGAIAKLSLAKSFPPNSTTTFSKMAAFAQIPESSIQRLVRHAICYHVFAEPSKGIIAHTSMSRALATVPNLPDIIEVFRDILWPLAPRLADAIIRWPGSEEANETAFNIATGTDLKFWDYLSQDSEKATRFAGSMKFLAAKPGREKEGLIDNVDWAESFEDGKKGVIVDVGGSHGGVALALAERFPEVKFVVQDIENVIEGAPKDGNERVEFQVHDFLTEQKVVADVYVLRQILHDWSDCDSKRILKGLIPALRKGARIVINDSILPGLGQVSKAKEGVMRHSDLMMWRCFNARERDEDDWRAVIEATDPRFKIVKVWTPPKTTLGIIEVVWEG